MQVMGSDLDLTLSAPDLRHGTSLAHGVRRRSVPHHEPRQGIFLVDPDRELFLDTLADTVHRFGWICHDYAANDQANAVRP